MLRGWRFFQAASLSKDEWRDILSATGNKLDFESVSNALQILWDEQLVQPRMASHNSGYPHFVNWLEDDSWSDPSWAAASEWWPDDGWYDSNWSYKTMIPGLLLRILTSLETPLHLQSLVLQSLRTLTSRRPSKVRRWLKHLQPKLAPWKCAQEATAALRRDRGFGAVKGSQKGSKGSNNLR